MADPTYFTCEIDGTDRFVQSRRIYTIKLEDGHKQRNWAVGPTDPNEMVCAFCGTLYRWNPDDQTWDIVPRILSDEETSARRASAGKAVKS